MSYGRTVKENLYRIDFPATFHPMAAQGQTRCRIRTCLGHFFGTIGIRNEVGGNHLYIKVPVVVRLQGNNAEIGAKVLTESGLNIIADTDLTGAAKKVVAAAANQ